MSHASSRLIVSGALTVTVAAAIWLIEAIQPWFSAFSADVAQALTLPPAVGSSWFGCVWGAGPESSPAVMLLAILVSVIPAWFSIQANALPADLPRVFVWDTRRP